MEHLLERLKRPTLELQPLAQSPNAYFRSMEKILKSVGASMHPWFTPVFSGKASDNTPLKQTMLCMSSWKEMTISSSLGEKVIFRSSLKSPLVLTRSKALLKSINAVQSDFCCSQHFSCNWHSEIISTVDHPALKPALLTCWMLSLCPGHIFLTFQLAI